MILNSIHRLVWDLLDYGEVISAIDRATVPRLGCHM